MCFCNLSMYLGSVNNMDDDIFNIVASDEQLRLLNGPKTIRSLKTADFLGDQNYINEWIMEWSQTNHIDRDSLPLCVDQTILTFPKIRKHYNRYVRAAVVSHDIDWIDKHYIVAYERVWNYVSFESIPYRLFSQLWHLNPVPFEMESFICSPRRLDIWSVFVDKYGPTECLMVSLRQRWSEGAAHCIDEGADLCAYDFIREAMLLDPEIFRSISSCNPPATAEAYSDFKLWRNMHRIKDVPLVEEFFWINGFKD